MKYFRGSEPIEKIDDLLGHLQAEVKYCFVALRYDFLW
jgi:hypothetical protein